jgi:hypothetical protein
MALLKFSEKSIQTIKSITNSTYLDIIGLIIVITASYILEYQKTVYNFTFHKTNYVFYLGYLSIVNTSFSMIGNRLITKKNNFGNFLSTCNTFFSGLIDFLLGNLGAILTYPVTFIGNYLVFKAWKKSTVLRSVDFIFYRNLVLGFVFSLLLNYIAFKYLSEKPIDWRLFFAVAIPAGLTFGATFNTARMYPDNWIMWQIYNMSKLIQNLLQMNIANTAKYVFYFFNAILGYITWNDDKEKGAI